MRRPSPTVEEVFEKYFKLHVSDHVSRPHEVKRGFELHWQGLAKKKAATLLTIELQEWLKERSEVAGAQTANRQFNTLRACLNWGVEMKLFRFVEENPCSSVKKMPVEERERYVDPDEEFARLKAVLDSQVSDIHDAIWVLLLTAARKSNVLEMKWADINFTARVWVIQASESKNRKTLRVPITERVMEILKRRAALYKLRSPWVFPQANMQDHLVNIDYRWRQIREEANLGDLHIHDLRHTAASWMGQNGGSAFAIQRMLGHSSSKMTERYTHLNVASVLNEMEASQSKVLGL